MDTIIILLLTALAVWWLWRTLERTHHRTEHLGHAPFGLDLENDRDIIRTLAEIEAARARQR